MSTGKARGRLTPTTTTPTPNSRSPQAPSYALVVFGCYALASIGLALVRFGDCPEAAAELTGEVASIKAALAARGFGGKGGRK